MLAVQPTPTTPVHSMTLPASRTRQTFFLWRWALCLALLAALLLPGLARAAANVPYLDASGGPQTAASATDLTGSETTLGVASTTTWYVCGDGATPTSLTYASTLTIAGNVNLILADGCAMKVTGASSDAGINVIPGNSLTLYAQSTGPDMGSLEAIGGNSWGAGIGGGGFLQAAGAITINGGAITATGGTVAAGIGGSNGGDGGTITINGGFVTANGGTEGAGIGGGAGHAGGNITINGGTIDATGGLAAAGIGGGQNGAGGAIMISGDANVTAIGGNGNGTGGAAGIGSGGTNAASPVSAGLITITTTGTVNATNGIGSSSNYGDGADIGQGGYYGGPGASVTNSIVIDTWPDSVMVTQGAITGSLTIAAHATITPVGAPTYQWYSNTTASSTGGTLLAGATNASFTIPTTLTAAGGPDYYYYCVVSATGATPVASNVATVTVSAAAPTPIASAAVTVAAPATGGTPGSTATPAGGSHFTVDTVTWSPTDNPFAANTAYTVTVKLAADSGYTFTGLAAANASINTNTAAISNNTGGAVTLSYTFAATGASPIATAAVTVTAPVAGSAPVATATPAGGSHFTVDTVTWSPTGNPFAPLTAYTVAVTLKADAGYTFTGLAAANASINTNTAAISNNTGGAVTLSYSFPATGTAAITSAAVTVTAPVAGNAPSSAGTSASGSHFTVGAVTWSPTDNPFVAGTSYTATVTLTAAAGYTFAGLTVADATFNGQRPATADVAPAGDTVTLTYAFPALAPLSSGGGAAAVPTLDAAALALLALALAALAGLGRRRGG